MRKLPPHPFSTSVKKALKSPARSTPRSFLQQLPAWPRIIPSPLSPSADRKPAATAKIPNTGKAFILIFVPAPKAPDALPWRVFVIEDSPANFPDAGAFVANFHNQEIRFILGEKKLMLKSGGAHGFASPTKLDSFNMAPVSFEFQQNGTWRVAKESMLRFLPGMRYLFFAYVDPTSGRPRISTFRDLSADSKANAAPEP